MKVIKDCVSKLYANSFFRLLKNLVLVGCAAFTGLSVISTSTFIPTAYGFATAKIEWLDSAVSPLAVAGGGIGVVIVCSLFVGHELHAAGKPRPWIAAPALLGIIAAVMAVLSLVSLQKERPSRTKREVVVIGISNSKAVERAEQFPQGTPVVRDNSTIEGAEPIATTETEGTTSSLVLKEEGDPEAGCTCPSGGPTVRPSGIDEGGGRKEDVVVSEGPEIEESSFGTETAAEARAEAQEAAAEAQAEGQEAACRSTSGSARSRRRSAGGSVHRIAVIRLGHERRSHGVVTEKAPTGIEPV